MAVLIKGIEMPKNCSECIILEQAYYCPFTLATQDFNDERHEKCPLIEVPEPHGRLIDADKLKSYWEPDHSRYFDADYFIHTIDAAQTIIPASEEK